MTRTLNLAFAALLATSLAPVGAPAQTRCEVAAEHPYARQNYAPDAPRRDRVGTGMVIVGTVTSSAGCQPVANARLEFWLNTTPQGGDAGEQNPDNRATVLADGEGRFRFETAPPQPVWAGAEPHIHVRITAPGHRDLWLRHVTNGDPQETIAPVMSAASGAGS